MAIRVQCEKCGTKMRVDTGLFVEAENAPLELHEAVEPYYRRQRADHHRGGCGGKLKRLPFDLPVANLQCVGTVRNVDGGGKLIVIQMPLRRPMTRAEALNLAAWLLCVADADTDDGDFLELLEKVMA